MRSGIIQKSGQCLDCPEGVTKALIAKRCQHHYWLYRESLSEKKEPKKPKPIPKISEKQIERLAKYRKVRDQFMKDHPKCQARLQGCTIKATDCHHSRGKVGDLLTDKRYFKALCRDCHRFLEVHPAIAKEKGFSLSRLENIENITNNL